MDGSDKETSKKQRKKIYTSPSEPPNETNVH